jgi:hypothetical protein
MQESEKTVAIPINKKKLKKKYYRQTNPKQLPKFCKFSSQREVIPTTDC